MNAVDSIYNEIYNKQLMSNTEYRNGNIECVTLLFPDTKEDVAKGLITDGLVLFEDRKEKRLRTLVGEYKSAQAKAKQTRVRVIPLGMEVGVWGMKIFPATHLLHCSYVTYTPLANVKLMVRYAVHFKLVSTILHTFGIEIPSALLL